MNTIKTMGELLNIIYEHDTPEGVHKALRGRMCSTELHATLCALIHGAGGDMQTGSDVAKFLFNYAQQAI